MSGDLVNEHWSIQVNFDPSLLMSNHVPISFALLKGKHDFKSGWPHFDCSLFKLNHVRNKAEGIFTASFNSNPNAFKAWDDAAKNT